MAGTDCDIALAERIRIEILASDLDFARMVRHLEHSISVTVEHLHPILRGLIVANAE